MSYGTGRPIGVVRISAGAILGAIVGAMVSATFIVAAAGPAPADTSLAASSPKDGGKIDRVPDRLVMEFTEPLRAVGYRIVVRGPRGQQYQSGAPRIAANKLTQPLKPLGPRGEYKVEFHVVADGGRALNGGTRFTLTKLGPAAGGSRGVARLAPFVGGSNSVDDAPPWAPWLEGAVVLIFVFGAVLFGRRVTRGLDRD